jgi:hypothetical protein
MLRFVASMSGAASLTSSILLAAPLVGLYLLHLSGSLIAACGSLPGTRQQATNPLAS